MPPERKLTIDVARTTPIAARNLAQQRRRRERSLALGVAQNAQGRHVRGAGTDRALRLTPRGRLASAMAVHWCGRGARRLLFLDGRRACSICERKA